MMRPDELRRKLIEVVGIGPALAEADRVLTMSVVLRELCAEAGVPAEKLVVLGNRVSTSRFRPVKLENYDPRTIRALFVGRLDPQKNLDGTAALAMLRGEGWRVHLDVCGGVRANRYLRRALGCLGPDEWHFSGAVLNRDLPARYAAVDMYVGPSHFEGFQIPLIEALACGKPSVASRQPPASEIIDEEVGTLVDPDDAADIAAGIRRLKERLNDGAGREALTAACRAGRWSGGVMRRCRGARRRCIWQRSVVSG